MPEIEFVKWPKISRFENEHMLITEKIDGTNGCIIFEDDENAPFGFRYAFQSRNRFITPESDNAGFAKACMEYLDELYADLGPGRHYGEWWGAGIQRGYGLGKVVKFFSLFNAPKWNHIVDERGQFKTPWLDTVPVLYSGPADWSRPEVEYTLLREFGSRAANFDNPEGVVIYLKNANTSYKITDAPCGPTKPRMPNE